MIAGVLLAAGAGTRYGRPKVLVADWLEHSIAALREGGCDRVYVVLGAARIEVADVEVVFAADWAEGLSASLRAGLAALGPEDAAVLTLVDLPDVDSRVVARLRAQADPDTLRRAVYDGRPGHPVVIGRHHWGPIAAQAHGDRGARDYLSAHHAEAVECGDLASGRDVDTP